MGRVKSSTPDWLPKGWKVEVRIRKSGKKDTFYIDPLNQRKFFSKPEVLRHLKNVDIKKFVRKETGSKSSRYRSAAKFIEEAAVVEGLPEGWIKQTRVSRKGNKIRRDAHYIEFVTGHIFRSLKEVFHYLNTGKKRPRASKRKEQEPNSLEFTQKSLSVATITDKKIIADNKAGKQVTGNQSLCTGPSIMDPESMIEVGKLEQGKKEISSGGSSPAAEAPLENLEGNGLEANKSKTKKRNRSKVVDMPRRTSKRLAGIEVDVPLQPASHTRRRRAAGRQISEAGESGPEKCESPANADEHVKKLSAGNETDLKPESVDVLPPGDSVVPEENLSGGVPECKANAKEEVPLNLPFSELWKDPCIEFAIKTLTGTIPIGDENGTTINEGASTSVSNVVADPCLDLPPMDIWSDPCFEFAVKTLTGDLPVENDPTLEALIKKPSDSSSQSAAQNGSSVPNIMSRGMSPGDKDSFRHSNIAADTPQAKQQL